MLQQELACCSKPSSPSQPLSQSGFTQFVCCLLYFVKFSHVPAPPSAFPVWIEEAQPFCLFFFKTTAWPFNDFNCPSLILLLVQILQMPQIFQFTIQANCSVFQCRIVMGQNRRSVQLRYSVMKTVNCDDRSEIWSEEFEQELSPKRTRIILVMQRNGYS